MSPLFSWVAKVPEIISSIRQAGRLARQEELHCPSEFDDTFSKKFEVLFCGRVTVAHKKAPPALIDECIEKFNHISCSRRAEPGPAAQDPAAAPSFTDRVRAALQPAGPPEQGRRPMHKSSSQPGLRSAACRREFQDGGLRSHSFFSSFDESDIENHLIGGHNIVQPTDIEENRTMLFTIGQSEVYLISPDTKKIALEKNFKEISFCSQGIRHVDHFGFICREASGGGFHFVCYVFQCTNEALVDEIMMTLKQAFTVAAVQQTRAPAQLCEGCPLQGLHKLCERIEGMNSSKTKLELQKHLTTLTNQEQAMIFEEVQKLRPRNEQRENEMVISFLRCLYEEKQKVHTHIGEIKQTTQIAAENIGSELPASATRFKLDMLKSKAKRSLAESLESILSRGNKARGLPEHSASLDLDCSVSSMLNNTNKEPSVSDKEALPVSESRTRLLGASEDPPSGDAEGRPAEEPAPLSPQPGPRRRANTLSHLPVESPAPPGPAQASPGGAQRKLVRYHSVSTETPHERKDLDSKTQHLGDPGGTPVKARRHSWRQQIFLRVATPQKASDSPGRYEDWSIGSLPHQS